MTGNTSTPLATLAMFTIDCADPRELAAFYHELLGWKLVHAEDEYGMIQGDAAPIGFARVADYQPPNWPEADTPKQFHLDFHVDDIDAMEVRALALGASRPAFQPGGERWRVLSDPAGHPFCLCPSRS